SWARVIARSASRAERTRTSRSRWSRPSWSPPSTRSSACAGPRRRCARWPGSGRRRSTPSPTAWRSSTAPGPCSSAIARSRRARDEVLTPASHGLRAPLNVRLGWGRMLRSGVLDDAATRHALDTIERNIRLQAQLIDDLLDVLRITSGKLRLDVRPVDIPAVVQAALDSVEVAAEAKSIRIETVLAPDLTPIL